MKYLLVFVLVHALGWTNPCNLERDLSVAEYFQAKECRKFPATYNFYLQGGIFTMPSARMGDDGEIDLGFSTTPHYYNWNGRIQILPLLELSGSYRVLRGVEDPLLSAHGFGDLADKGVNFKVTLWKPEDTNYRLPSIAFGWDDFLGTKRFQAQYIAATQVISCLNLEATIGWGRERIRGFFGGLQYFPFWHTNNMWIDGIALGIEYDATPYHNPRYEPNPAARLQKSKINYGIKYRFLDFMDLSLAYLKGKQICFAASMFYNFGHTQGFVPKCDDKLPYTCPKNLEPINTYRPPDYLMQELFTAFCDQGLELLDAYIYTDSCQNKVLRIRFQNLKYRYLCEIEKRLAYLLANLLPSDIDRVHAVQETYGMSIQEFEFWGIYLREFCFHNLSLYELETVSSLHEVTCIDTLSPQKIFHKHLPFYSLYLLPRTHTYFGSSKGKFKYATGLTFCMDGFLTPWEIYYSLQLGYLLFSSLGNASDVDMLNPSQLPNVHTDIITYEKQNGVQLDQFYIQKNLAIGYGFYGRASLGYFDPAYAGFSSEVLYYPVASPFAIGIEGAVVFKRTYGGIGFTNKVRQLVHFTPTYRPFVGSQYFLDFYYDNVYTALSGKLSLGKFLANDWGGRLELCRYFPSGLRVYAWYTVTNGNDKINGHTYYDKGVGFSMPLDIFFSCSSTERFGYAMSAWLRDVGYRTPVGESLYDLIYYERQ